MTNFGARHKDASPKSGNASPQTKWKKYPLYKDSGVEGLVEIPQHWKVLPIKRRVCSLKDGTHGTFERVHDGVPLLSAKNVGPDCRLHINDKESLISEEDYELIHRNGYLRRGDLLLTIVGTIGRAAIFDSLEPVAFQRSVAVIRPIKQLIVKFLLYLSQSDFFQRAMQYCLKKSAQGGVYLSDIAQLPVLDLPHTEQNAIASLLDRETAKIDALVEKKEKLIELLKEKRAALITQAVANGLDPTVPMKDSGVEWLGKIPDHWRMNRLKYLSTINDETLKENTDPNLEILYVDITSVDQIKGIVNKENIVFGDAPSRARRIVKNGDVIISTVRTYLKAIAPIYNAKQNLIVSTGFAVIRPRKLNASFATYAILSNYFIQLVVANSYGVSYPAINESKLACYYIAHPKEVEQRAIASFLDRETAKIDALVEKIQKGIALLKEYRSALISAAVTGKIDVRNEVLRA